MMRGYVICRYTRRHRSSRLPAFTFISHFLFAIFIIIFRQLRGAIIAARCYA